MIHNQASLPEGIGGNTVPIREDEALESAKTIDGVYQPTPCVARDPHGREALLLEPIALLWASST